MESYDDPRPERTRLIKEEITKTVDISDKIIYRPPVDQDTYIYMGVLINWFPLCHRTTTDWKLWRATIAQVMKRQSS